MQISQWTKSFMNPKWIMCPVSQSYALCCQYFIHFLFADIVFVKLYGNFNTVCKSIRCEGLLYNVTFVVASSKGQKWTLTYLGQLVTSLSGRYSSVVRVLDCRSKGPRFESGCRLNFFFPISFTFVILFFVWYNNC